MGSAVDLSLQGPVSSPNSWTAILADASGLPEWTLILLTAMTVTVVTSAHWHSAAAAWAEVRARQFPSRWRRVLSYVLRHQFHYARRVPMLIVFVLASVVAVVCL
jgi:hypothetical protein